MKKNTFVILGGWDGTCVQMAADTEGERDTETERERERETALFHAFLYRKLCFFHKLVGISKQKSSNLRQRTGAENKKCIKQLLTIILMHKSSN